MYNNTDNNAIYIDTKSSTRKRRKINCVLCFPKVELNCVNPDEQKWKCPRCKNDYQLLESGGDIIQEEDELISSHEQNDEGPVLIYAEDNNMQVESVLNDNKPKSDIKIPKYMQDSETSKVEYHEY